MGPGTASPCSSRSAINRNASACTAAVACFLVRPYAVTPGSAAMSASQRPSSSRKYSIASEKPVGDFGMNPSCHRFADPGKCIKITTSSQAHAHRVGGSASVRKKKAESALRKPWSKAACRRPLAVAAIPAVSVIAIPNDCKGHTSTSRTERTAGAVRYTSRQSMPKTPGRGYKDSPAGGPSGKMLAIC